MTTFHTAQVQGLQVFYRQAGDPASPKLLLLGASRRRRTSSGISSRPSPTVSTSSPLTTRDSGTPTCQTRPPGTTRSTISPRSSTDSSSRSPSPERWASSRRTTAARSETGSSPPTLIIWGQGDIFFTPEGGEAYLRDLPDAKLVRLDSGHLDVITEAIIDFHARRTADALIPN